MNELDRLEGQRKACIEEIDHMLNLDSSANAYRLRRVEIVLSEIEAILEFEEKETAKPLDGILEGIFNSSSKDSDYEHEKLDNAREEYFKCLINSNTSQGDEYRKKVKARVLDSSINAKKELLRLGAIEHEQADNLLYYLKLRKGGYKIGITSNRRVKDRYPSVSEDDYTILYAERVINAKSIESMVKQSCAICIVNEDESLGTAGTEIFSRDVLNINDNLNM